MYYLYKAIDPHITYVSIGRIMWSSSKEDSEGWAFVSEVESPTASILCRLQEEYLNFKRLNSQKCIWKYIFIKKINNYDPNIYLGQLGQTIHFAQYPGWEYMCTLESFGEYYKINNLNKLYHEQREIHI